MSESEKTGEQRIPPRKPVWNIWQALFLIILVNTVEYPLGWLKTPNDLDSVRGIFRFIGIGLGDVALSLLVIWAFMKLIRRPYSDLGFVKPRKRFIVMGFLAGFFLFISIGLVGNVLMRLIGTPTPQSFSLAVMGSKYIWEFGFLLLLGGALAPLKEEIFFRSIIYPPLRKALGRGKGMFVAGILFAVLHFDMIRFIPLLLGGIVLSWLYEKSESIWPSIIAHGTWNVFMASALWIQRF